MRRSALGIAGIAAAGTLLIAAMRRRNMIHNENLYRTSPLRRFSGRIAVNVMPRVTELGDFRNRNFRPAAATADASLQGSVLVLIQFDVCEEIHLDQLQQIFGARTVEHPGLEAPDAGIRPLRAPAGRRTH